MGDLRGDYPRDNRAGTGCDRNIPEAVRGKRLTPLTFFDFCCFVFAVLFRVNQIDF
jgi:hypothetical protein